MSMTTTVNATAIAAILTIYWCVNAPSQPSSPTADKSAEAIIDRASELFVAADAPAHLVAYHYKFDGRRTVRIRSVGLVPAQGAFEHILREGTLDFLDADTSVLLVSLPIKPTVFVAAKPPLNEVPKLDGFPAAFKAYSWTEPASLPPAIDAVLGKYFHYLPSERDGRTYFATTYTPLRLAPHLVKSGVVAQTALLLSFPYGKTPQDHTIRVQQLIKEGRTHSDDFRPTANDEIIRASGQFVDELVGQLMAQKSTVP